jgi:hypothetical protein
LVEQRIENPRVGGSNPPPGTILTPGEIVFFDQKLGARPSAANLLTSI